MITLSAKTVSGGFPLLHENKVLSCHLTELSETNSFASADGKVVESDIWLHPTPQIVVGIKTPIGTYFERLSLQSYFKEGDASIDESYLKKNPQIQLVEDPKSKAKYYAILDAKTKKWDRLVKTDVSDNIVDGKLVKDALPAYKMLARLAKISVNDFKAEVDIAEANNLICEKGETGVFALPKDKEFYGTFGPKNGRTQLFSIYSRDIYEQKLADRAGEAEAEETIAEEAM